MPAVVDFRYHLVSIIAIFLALALGVVVGTTYLNGQFVDGLEASIRGLTGDKRTLEATVGQQRTQLASDAQLVETVTPALVSGWLSGQRVVLVSAPDTTGVRDELVPVLEGAGATVTLQVQLRPDLLDPLRAPALDDLVARLSTGSTTGSTSQERAFHLLAAALARTGEQPRLSDREAAAVLEGFDGLDLLDADEPAGERATLAVLVAAEPTPGPQPTGQPALDAGLVALATALDEAGDGVVVAGSRAAADGDGLLRAVREDGAAAALVSSVDGADRPPGRVAAVAALREQATGQSGHYGTGQGSSGPLPSVPLPSVPPAVPTPRPS